MLKGQDLIDKLEELKGLEKSALLRECGYATVKDGREILNFSAFYEAVLEAKGVNIEKNDEEDLDADAFYSYVIVDGFIEIQLPDDLPRSPIGKYGVFIDEWDPYYPGCPLRVFTLDEDCRIPKDSGLDPDYANSFDSIASSDGDALSIEGDWLVRGQRYVVEADVDEWYFALEPMPWNGLRSSTEEYLRLLILPKQSVGDLLSLCHPEQESLFDANVFESFEAALADSLGRALASKDSEATRAFLAKFNHGDADIDKLVKSNWLSHDTIRSLPLLNNVLEQFSIS